VRTCDVGSGAGQDSDTHHGVILLSIGLRRGRIDGGSWPFPAERQFCATDEGGARSGAHFAMRERERLVRRAKQERHVRLKSGGITKTVTNRQISRAG